MPCMECKNGKWKYGKEGNCQFDSKKECEKAKKAIHASKDKKKGSSKK